MQSLETLKQLCKTEGLQMLYDGKTLILQRETLNGIRLIDLKTRGTFKSEISALIDCFWFGNEYIINSGQLEKYGFENWRTFDYAGECYQKLFSILSTELVRAFKQYIKGLYYVSVTID